MPLTTDTAHRTLLTMSEQTGRALVWAVLLVAVSITDASMDYEKLPGGAISGLMGSVIWGVTWYAVLSNMLLTKKS